MSHLKTAHVTILPTGKASVNGSTVEIAKLGNKLKSLGARADTTIYVAVPADVSNVMIVDVTRSLATSGFSKVFFTKPVEKTATVSDKSAPSQPAPTPAAKPTKAKPTKAKTPTSQKPVRSGTL